MYMLYVRIYVCLYAGTHNKKYLKRLCFMNIKFYYNIIQKVFDRKYFIDN